MELKVELSRQEIDRLNYPILVDAWEKKATFSGKRKYNEVFSRSEQDEIECFYEKAYKWRIITGTPEKASATLETWHLIKRAIGFFSQL